MNQISPLAFVHPEAKLGDNNIIGPFCYIDKDTVLGDNNVLQNSVTIHVGARIGNNNEFFPGASISTKPQDLKFKGEVTTCEVGDNNSIRENVTISRGTASKGKTVVGSNNLLMETVHVAHDCVLGSGLIIGNSTKFAGEVVVDDNAIVSANVLVQQFHQVIVEVVRLLRALSCPDDELGAVGKVPARDIGRWICLSPRNDIQDFESQLRQLVCHGEDIVIGSRYPNGTILLQMFPAFCNPFLVE